MIKMICSLIFKLIGWKIVGKLPELDKFIIIVAPHTSSWDFPLGVLARAIMNRKIRYLGKKELFRPPFGWIFRALGGYPVDRQQSQSMVDRVAEIFRQEDAFLLALAPEGTRSQVSNWRTGFYHMAVKAEVPIQMVGLDYPRKEVKIMDLFYPSGSIEQDMPLIRARFSKFRGKI
jgi:1-acyl-sn-glycerol-3-phosphate acyltransferase